MLFVEDGLRDAFFVGVSLILLQSFVHSSTGRPTLAEISFHELEAISVSLYSDIDGLRWVIFETWDWGPAALVFALPSSVSDNAGSSSPPASGIASQCWQ
ncbi:unnamed protein product [Pleuronectes platessa]|uniref:Uncharacterized protein n=1 Tax=Pleuronectes platessa TaxID=8262 RepID=A0A9N7VAX8_PLEPL|nr:unnamed protein product [Pleuronectes platessa]